MSNMSRRHTDLPLGVERTSVSAQLLHDLRSPLNQIIGYAEIMSEEADGQRREDFVVDLQKVRSAGHRLLALIEENFTSGNEKSLAVVALIEAETLEDAAPANQPDIAPGRIVVVDDDPANRDVLTRRLERQGHEVISASNGRDAVRLLRSAAFDLVLLDIMMPDMDGYEVLGEIKGDEALRHIPVIMISALNEMKSVVRCIEAGAEDYLAKPFDATLLRARIGACLEKKRGRDRETVLYEQLQENYKRLEELEQQRDDLRNMIVHDLRTPLTSVIIGVEMLSTHGALTEMQDQMMRIAVNGGKTLLGMINDLLDVEKMEAGQTQLQYEQLSPAVLVASAVEQVMPLVENGDTTLVVTVAANLPPFAGDANKLSRTLVNLIANAVRFTPAGTVEISAAQSGESIRFAIRDTGAGIPAESFGRIFEKFGQLDGGGKVGTGLGLPFCKLAVEAHHGTIDVESTPGVGSTFSFSIPLSAPGR